MSEKKAWTDFKASTKLEFEFLHKDEFEKQYKQTFDYPIILENLDTLKVVIGSNELSELQNVEELINKIKQLKT